MRGRDGQERGEGDEPLVSALGLAEHRLERSEICEDHARSNGHPAKDGELDNGKGNEETNLLEEYSRSRQLGGVLKDANGIKKESPTKVPRLARFDEES